ncbi:MAG: asparaginase [Saprospiraceae bacterium]|nr:asparaginase [Saprospiraceae bacterium]
MVPKLIIHGGAWNIPIEYEKDHLDGIREALTRVYPLLLDGASALDSVEQAVNILEANPTYDSGRGAFLNHVGGIELDAIIVDGRDINFGAVAGVKNILHPVTLARRVMERTEHCFLIGQGANEFARKEGFEILDTQDLLTERELEFYNKIKSDPNFHTKIPFDHPSDTVGAVAKDKDGNLAAATSTGGTPRKLQGRVGDSPILGAGAYADNVLGAASTTGWGEGIMRAMLAFRVVDRLKDKGKEASVEEALSFMKNRIDGLAGIIGITPGGEYFYGYNTPKMAFGYMDTRKVFLHIK